MRDDLSAVTFFKLIAVCALLVMLFTACDQRDERAALEMTGGVASRGPAAIQRYGCSTCHTVPGVSGANGLVGPPLSQVGSRVYLAGRLRNTPDNMIRWIRDPQGVDDKTAMPNLGVTEIDAQDITSYLYTLK